MAVYVIAVFLCGIDDGSGHDYASADEHLSLSTVLHFFNAILGALLHITQISESIFKCWPRLRYEKKQTALYHIAMLIFDIIAYVQFTINNYSPGFYN